MKRTAIYLAAAVTGVMAASAPVCAQMENSPVDPGRPYPYDYSYNDSSGSYEQGYGYGHGYPYGHAYGSVYGHPYDYASPSAVEREVTSPLATGQDR